MKRGFRLGHVFGVEIVADASLFVIAGLLTWSLYLDLEQGFPGTDGGTLLAVSFGGGVVFLASVLAHELSHSFVAIRRGLTVRRIRLFIFGGVSEIEQEAATPRDELAVTLAGPAASIVLGGLFILAAWALPIDWALADRIVATLGVANLSIGIFNLLPGLPLDGGRVLRALVWKVSGDRARATRIAVHTGKGLGAILVSGGVFLLFWHGSIAAIWFVAIGWFLYQAASTSELQEQLADRIAGMTVGDVMRSAPMAIAGDETVAAALELHGWGDRLRTMPVAVDGRVVGVFGDREIARVKEEERSSTTVADAMTVIGPNDVIDRAEPLDRALASEAGSSGILVVVADGRVVGLLTGVEMEALLGDLGRRSRSRRASAD